MYWPTGIRVRLLLLAGLCILPVVALFAYEAWQASVQDINDARADLQVRTASAAADLDKDLQSGRMLSLSMAQVPAIVQLTPGECRGHVAILAAPYQQIGSASGIGIDGTLQCSMEPDGDSAVKLANRDLLRRRRR